LEFVPGFVDRVEVTFDWVRVRVAVETVKDQEDIPEGDVGRVTGEFVTTGGAARTTDESGAVESS
jgi:hypothetical protein